MAVALLRTRVAATDDGLCFFLYLIRTQPITTANTITRTVRRGTNTVSSYSSSVHFNVYCSPRTATTEPAIGPALLFEELSYECVKMKNSLIEQSQIQHYAAI